MDVTNSADIARGARFDGEEGSSRVANFVVLKEKDTGATLLVANTHWANDNPAAQKRAAKVMNEEIEKIKADPDIPVDGVVALGGFNAIRPQGLGLDRAQFGSTMKTWDEGYNLDHILVGEGVSGGKTTMVKDGGESDHNRVSTTIRVDYTKNDPRKASLDDVNQGAVLYEDANYEGERTVVGFGNESNDGNWNDSTSSIRLGEDTSLTVREHSENDERFGTPENDPPREIDADRRLRG